MTNFNASLHQTLIRVFLESLFFQVFYYSNDIIRREKSGNVPEG
jgi:hypothetical protein